ADGRVWLPRHARSANPRSSQNHARADERYSNVTVRLAAPRSLEVGRFLAASAILTLGTNPRSLERFAHLGEHRADLTADKLDCNDDDERDQARDERVFDRGHAGFVAEKGVKSCHRILPAFEWSLRPQSRLVSSPDFTTGPTGLRLRLPP